MPSDSEKPVLETDDDFVLPRRPYWKWTLAAAGVTAALSWIALLPSKPATHDSPTNVLEPASPEASDAPAVTPDRAAPLPDRRTPAPSRSPRASQPPAAPARPSQPDDDARDLRALASDNAGDRIEALRSIRDRNAVGLLPHLLARDPVSDPDASPTLIKVSAELAQHADLPQRAATAARLGEWLKSESNRSDADARANVSVIVETLGRLDSPESVSVLIAALDGEQLPVHVATLAARGLEKLGDPTAREAVERFRARVSDAPAADGFERELYAEALATADSALSKWSH